MESPRRGRARLLICASSPLATRAMASGCWRASPFQDRQCACGALLGIRDSEDISPEVTAVSNVNRKHPVSIAVSMALLAAAASAVAAESAGAGAENAAAGSPAQQD